MLFVLQKCDKDCKTRSFKNTPSPCLEWKKKRKRNDQGKKVSRRKTSRQSDIQYTEPYKLHQAPFPLKRISGDLCAGWLCLDPRMGSLSVCLFYHSLGKEHGSRAVAGLRWSQD